MVRSRMLRQIELADADQSERVLAGRRRLRNVVALRLVGEARHRIGGGHEHPVLAPCSRRQPVTLTISIFFVGGACAATSAEQRRPRSHSGPYDTRRALRLDASRAKSVSLRATASSAAALHPCAPLVAHESERTRVVAHACSRRALRARRRQRSGLAAAATRDVCRRQRARQHHARAARRASRATDGGVRRSHRVVRRRARSARRRRSSTSRRRADRARDRSRSRPRFD